MRDELTVIAMRVAKKIDARTPMSQFDRSPHTYMDENHRPKEIVRSEEFQRARELVKNKEFAPSQEIQRQYFSSSKKDDKQENQKKSKIITQYLTSIATVVTAGAVVAVPILSKPSFDIGDEVIGYANYSCNLTIDNEEDNLDVIIRDMFGEVYDVLDVDNLDSATIAIDNLEPDRSYEIVLQTDEGKEYQTYKFTTPSLVTFGEVESNRLPFDIDVDASFATDMGARMFTSDGLSVDNIIYDGDVRYIALDGLYMDTYVIEVAIYPMDKDPVIQTVEMQLGTLIRPNFDISFEFLGLDTIWGEVTLAKLDGDMGQYTNFEVEFENVNDYNDRQTLSGESVALDGDNIILSLTNMLNVGTHSVTLYGEMEVDGYTIQNIIFKGDISITEDMFPA